MNLPEADERRLSGFSNLFRVRKPRPVGVVRDNGSAGHFSLARSDGVLDDWSIGKTLTGYSARKAQDRHVLCNVLDFQNPSLNSRQLLQYSIAPTTPGPEGWLLAPFQGAPNKAMSSGRGFFTTDCYLCITYHLGTPLVYYFSADYGHFDFNILYLLLWYGKDISVQYNHIGKFTSFDGALYLLFK